MLTREYFENALIKGEDIKPILNYDHTKLNKKHYSDEEILSTLKTDRQKGLKMYKFNVKDSYEVWLLDGFIRGVDKIERKEWLLEHIKTLESNLNGKFSTDMDLTALEAVIELYNKYFSKEKECFTVKKDNKNVLVEWIVNRVMKLHTKEEGYVKYGIYTEIEDYYNLKLNGEYTKNKFTIYDKKYFIKFDDNKNVILDI